MDPDFSGSDPDFRQIQIRTQEKKFETLFLIICLSWKFEFATLKLLIYK